MQVHDNGIMACLVYMNTELSPLGAWGWKRKKEMMIYERGIRGKHW